MILNRRKLNDGVLRVETAEIRRKRKAFKNHPPYPGTTIKYHSEYLMALVGRMMPIPPKNNFNMY